MNALITYFKNVRGEMKHVVWPNQKQAAMHTFIIIVISAVVALIIAALDFVFAGVVSRFISGY